MPDPSRAPAFLHQSYQHENVLELCGFTSIANVQPPATGTTTITSERKNERWLIWADKRRGLLGRTVVTCPTRTNPPPGRRHTQQFSAGQTAAVAPGSDHTPRRNEVHQAKRSLSLLTGLAAHHAKVAAASAASNPILVGTGETCPKDDEGIAGKDSRGSQEEKADEGVGCGQDDRLGQVGIEEDSSQEEKTRKDGRCEQSTRLRQATTEEDSSQEEKTDNGVECDQGKRLPYIGVEEDTRTLRMAGESSSYDNYVGSIATPSNHPPLNNNDCEKAQVLLDGLNNPSRVAAVTGRKNRGVFFIDEAAVEEDDCHQVKAVLPKKHHANHQSDSCLQHQPTRRVGRVRFLPWGAREAITLVERLCNPIALCVHADSSVFVLEELWETTKHHRDGTREAEGKRLKQFRVCCMGGTELSAWLDYEEKREMLCKDRPGRFQYNGKWKYAKGAGDHVDDVAGGTTDTKSEVAANNATGELSSKNDRNRGVVDFIEVLALPAPPPESCGHPEHPVDLCVLNDRTIVVAFYRSAPLHGGAAVSENQGAIRVFPVTRQEGHHFDAPSRANEAGETLGRSPAATASRPATNTDVDSTVNYYSGDESWLVADGLPVVTGIDAGGGRGIYFSLCGAGRDGAVTAIGSLSTAVRGSPALPRSPELGADDKGDALASGEIATRDGRRMGGESGSCGAKFVRVVSGFAAALTVDEDMNLFYITAENKRACHALWCSVPGTCSRRVSILCEITPTLLGSSALVASAQPSGVPRGGVVVAVSQSDAGSEGSAEGYPKKPTEGGRHAQRGKANLDTAVATEVAAAGQAVALSAALTEEDQAARAEIGGRKPLFASHRAVVAQAKGSERLDGEGRGSEPANIVVVSRCRPLLLREIKRGVRAAVFCDGDEIVVQDKALPASRSRRFGFDRVFGPNTSQARVYAEGVSPVVRKMLDGYNCSVLAYGQTGSGKTFTMEGGLSGYPSSPARGNSSGESRAKKVTNSVENVNDGDDLAAVSTDDIGIIPRAVHTIFREGGGGGTRRYWVYVSHMEIYNERLFDLLAPEAAAATGTPLSPPPSPKRRSPRATSGAKSPRSTGVSLPRSSPRPLSPQRQNSSRPLSPRRQNSPRPLSPRRQNSPRASSPRRLNSPRPLSPRRRHSPRAERERGDGGDGKSDRSDGPSSSNCPRRSDRGVQFPAGGGTSPRLSPLNVEVPCAKRRSVQDRPWNLAGGVGRGLAIEENRELGVIVKGLTQVEVKSPEEIFAIIARSKTNRRTAETMCNVESSRSHGIFCVRVISAEPTPWGGEITRDGRLSLVDLSGSENIKKSGAVGARAKEAAAIGQSLLALGRVIKALVNGAPHIPYRESKLTRVLGDSLGGNAFTAIILNITPNHGMLDETLNTLLYAKTAQSVRNAPKQHITNRPPSEVNTAGEVASDAKNFGVNASIEKKRLGAATAARSSLGPSRVHIRPWESKVPIRGFPSQSVPASSHSFDKPHDTDTGEHGNAPSRVVGGRRGRRRPATAGATRSMSGTQVLSHQEQRYSDERGYSAAGREVSPMPVGAREARSERGVQAAVHVAHGMLASVSEQQLLKRSGHDPPALQHAASDSAQAWGTSKEQPQSGGGSSSPTSGEKKTSCREFSSTAAVWVHSVVLEPSNHAIIPLKTSHAGNPPAGLKEFQLPPSSARRKNSSSAENIRLSAVAQRAIEEIFDRYDIEDQGFLPSSGISSIQEIWTRPDAEPPPLRRPTSASFLLRPRRETTEPSKNRRGSAARLAGSGCEPGKRGMSVLPRKSFVEFCHRAATRDAIFIRHMFTRSGYDYRLEFSPGTAEAAVASAAVSARSPVVARARSIARGERKLRGDTFLINKGPKVVVETTGRANTMQGSSSRDLLRLQRGVSRGSGVETAGGGGGAAARPRRRKGTEMGQQSHRLVPTQEGLLVCEYDNSDIRELATGSIVDAAELWGWTEDRRDHEERHEQGGLLSRGGGARVSRVAPRTTTAGGFENRTYAKQHPGSTPKLVTGDTTSGSSGYEEGVRAAPASSNRDLETTDAGTGAAPCSPIPPVTAAAAAAHDRDATCGGETLPFGDRGGSRAGGTTGDIAPAQQEIGGLSAVAMVDDDARVDPSEEPILAHRVSPCVWCGAVFDGNGGVAVHTAEFCDEDSVIALDAR